MNEPHENENEILKKTLRAYTSASHSRRSVAYMEADRIVNIVAAERHTRL